jgi:replication factor C large subunit
MDLGKFGVDVKEQEKTQNQSNNPKNDNSSTKAQAINDIKLDFNLNQMRTDFKGVEVERYLPWFLKYQVEKFDDLIITAEIQKIIDFIENFKPGKAILLAGAPGSGKTTTLNLLGEKYDFEIFEMNASDTRNKKSIQEAISDVIKQKSLFAKDKLILIDEVDGVSGRNDRGGVSELSKIVKESKYPICFTANDKESDKIKTLKRVATYIDFENHSQELLHKTAIKIFTAEKVKFDEKDLLTFIDERNTTDIRGFINDLQACVYESKFELDIKLEIRDYKKKINLLLDKVYYSYPEESFKSSYNTDINLDELFLYVEENTPLVYDNKANIKAFNEITKADVFRGRIMKWQHWRYLVYINFYLTYGISNSKNTPNKVKEYKRNGRILYKWILNNKVNSLNPRTRTQKKNEEEPKFIEKICKAYGRSAKRTRKDDLRFFSIIYQNDEEFKKAMDNKYHTDDATKKALIEI